MTGFLKRFPILVVLVASCMVLLNLLQPVSAFAHTTNIPSDDCISHNITLCNVVSGIINELQPQVTIIQQEEDQIIGGSGCTTEEETNPETPTTFRCNTGLNELYQKVDVYGIHRLQEINELKDILKLEQPTQDDLTEIIREFHQDEAQDHAEAALVRGYSYGCAGLIEAPAAAGICKVVAEGLASLEDSQAAPDYKRATELETVRNGLPMGDS